MKRHYINLKWQWSDPVKLWSACGMVSLYPTEETRYALTREETTCGACRRSIKFKTPAAMREYFRELGY